MDEFNNEKHYSNNGTDGINSENNYNNTGADAVNNANITGSNGGYNSNNYTTGWAIPSEQTYGNYYNTNGNSNANHNMNINSNAHTNHNMNSNMNMNSGMNRNNNMNSGSSYSNYTYSQSYNSSEPYKNVKSKKVKNKDKNKEKNRFGAFVKKGAILVAGAAIFGLVAGGVFKLSAAGTIKQLNEAKETQQNVTGDTATLHMATSDDSTETSVSPVVSTSGQSMDVSEIAENCMPSVVSVYIKSIIEYNQGFFGSYEYESDGSGSGIIISSTSSEICIVTNNHVVEGADSVKVGFIDGTTYDAVVKSTDPDNDLAVIVVKVNDVSEDTLKEIKVATIGDSDALKVGEQVVAIGNALGYGQSVTTGIVSAKDRENSTNSLPLIQTDAAINPGNSGGALLNMKGEVVGINSSKYASTEVEGMGYAIPITSVTEIIDEMMNEEIRQKVDSSDVGYLGIECGTVTDDMINFYGAPAGVYVSRVLSGGGAYNAGLPEDSIITKIDGKTVKSTSALTNALQYYKVGDTVEVTYYVLENNEYVEYTKEVTLGKKIVN